MEKPVLNDAALYYLAEASKWARFIAILSFILLGLLILLGFFMGFLLNIVSSMSGMPFPFPPGFFAGFYIIFGLIWFIPTYYLYRFSVDLRKALSLGKEEELTSAFRFLKGYYKFIGIMTIIMLALSVLGSFAAMMAGMFGFMAGQGIGV